MIAFFNVFIQRLSVDVQLLDRSASVFIWTIGKAQSDMLNEFNRQTFQLRPSGQVDFNGSMEKRIDVGWEVWAIAWV